jgi:WD40 repeat protein
MLRRQFWPVLLIVALLAAPWPVPLADGKAPAPDLPPAKPEVLHSIEWQDKEQGFPAHIYQTGISPDGKLFFGAGDAGPTGSIRIFEVATGKQVQDLRPASQAWFGFAAFVPGGNYLLSSYSREKDIYLWDIAKGEVVRKFAGHSKEGVGFAVAPDGKRLLSWGEDHTVRLWDLETGKELRKLEGHTDKAAGVFSPNGKTILTFSPDKTLRLWDADTGKQLLKLEGHTNSCTGCLSPDDKLVLSGSADQTTRLWDAATGKEIQRFEGGKLKEGVRFVADGRQVAAYCDDQKYRFWDTDSGKIVQEINLSSVGANRSTITLSPDGRLALVSHQDNSVRLLDMTTGKDIHTYAGCPGARGFSFSPDNKYAVAGSFRAGLHVFRLPTGEK